MQTMRILNALHQVALNALGTRIFFAVLTNDFLANHGGVIIQADGAGLGFLFLLFPLRGSRIVLLGNLQFLSGGR